MRKYSIHIILAGMLLVLASCVPVVNTLYRMAAPDPPQRVELLPDGSVQQEFAVGGHDKIMLSLVIDAVKVESGPVELHYAYTLQNGSRVQQQHAGSVEVRDAGTPDPENTTEGATPIVIPFPIMQLDDAQESVTVDIDLQIPGKEIVLVGARAEIHLDPPYFAMSFVNAIIVWTLGTLLVLIGAIQWARSVAATPVVLDKSIDAGQERFWCMWCHLGALLGYILPFGHILAPLVIWVTKRRQVPGVDEAGRESLNFQLTVTFFALIGIMLSTVVVGLFVLFVLVVFHFSLTLFAALRAQRGEQVRYPVNFRIISPAG